MARTGSGEVKLPEKTYTCFWCEATFRKRGKLMDHIDMFHKANKQQTEAQADRIQSSTNSPSSTATQSSVGLLRQNSLTIVSSANPARITPSLPVIPAGKVLTNLMTGASQKKVASYTKPGSCTPGRAPATDASKWFPQSTKLKPNQLDLVDIAKSLPPFRKHSLVSKTTIGSHELLQSSPYPKVCIFTAEGSCHKRRSIFKRYDNLILDKCKFIYKKHGTIDTDVTCQRSQRDRYSKASTSVEEINQERMNQPPQHQREQDLSQQELEQEQHQASLSIKSRYPIAQQIAPMPLSYPYSSMNEQSMSNFRETVISPMQEEGPSSGFPHRDFNMGLLYPQLLFKPSIRGPSSDSSSTQGDLQLLRTEKRDSMPHTTNNYRNPDIPLDLSNKL